jgi:hypothetical protein
VSQDTCIQQCRILAIAYIVRAGDLMTCQSRISSEREVGLNYDQSCIEVPSKPCASSRGQTGGITLMGLNGCKGHVAGVE